MFLNNSRGSQALVAHTFKSQHLVGRDRQISLSSRPAWFTQRNLVLKTQMVIVIIIMYLLVIEPFVHFKCQLILCSASTACEREEVDGGLQSCEQGFPVQPRLPWSSLCRPGWPQTQRSTCFYHPKGGIKDHLCKKSQNTHS